MPPCNVDDLLLPTMEHGRQGVGNLTLQDIAALTRVSTMMAEGTQQTELARALGLAVAVLSDHADGGEVDMAVVLPILTRVTAELRGFVSSRDRLTASLAESLRLISEAVALTLRKPGGVHVPNESLALPADPDLGLMLAADNYDEDARRSARTTLWLYTGGTTLALLALVSHWLLVLNQLPRPAASDFLVQSLPFLCLVVLSTLVVMHANHQRRTTEELRRLARQLRTLPAYLLPLPIATQALLRSTLTQRLFPRLSDDDLLREPDAFPSADYLMDSITNGEDHHKEKD